MALERVRAVPGRGLEGDRYYARAARGEGGPGTEVTLISAEGLAEAEREHGLTLEPGEHRRNIVTSGVDLDDLIGATFRVGDAILEGVKPNPPCRRLVTLTGRDVLKPLIRRGGIRARIVEPGEIAVGAELDQIF